MKSTADLRMIRSNRSSPIDRAGVVPADAEVQFPAARYFQVHFEHIYELLAELKDQVLAANQQIGQLQRRVDDSPSQKQSPLGSHIS